MDGMRAWKEHAFALDLAGIEPLDVLAFGISADPKPECEQENRDPDLNTDPDQLIHQSHLPAGLIHSYLPSRVIRSRRA